MSFINKLASWNTFIYKIDETPKVEKYIDVSKVGNPFFSILFLTWESH